MDYEFTGEFLRTAHHVVWRGKRRSDGLPVLLKTGLVLSAGRRADLQREFDTLQQLTFSGIPHAIEIVHHADRDYLVVEDQGLRPLAATLTAQCGDLQAFFSLALALCDIVAELHRHDVILGVLTPNAILVGDGGAKVQIADLSAVQRGPVDVAAIAASVLTSGGAAYVAPEQTGRINRIVDHRADLYVLGALLYEVLTGRPPFDTTDALELVHSHIARMPRPPAAIATAVPEQISRVIVRLLAKGAEDRYQSARGLKRDLETCRREWKDTGSI